MKLYGFFKVTDLLPEKKSEGYIGARLLKGHDWLMVIPNNEFFAEEEFKKRFLSKLYNWKFLVLGSIIITIGMHTNNPFLVLGPLVAFFGMVIYKEAFIKRIKKQGSNELDKVIKPFLPIKKPHQIKKGDVLELCLEVKKAKKQHRGLVVIVS